MVIKPGLSDNKYIEMLSGDLRPGDALITENLRQDKAEKKPAGGSGGGFKVKMF